MACISKAWISSNVHQVRIISLTIFLFICSPGILLAILLLQLYRNIVSVVALILESDIAKIIPPSSTILASDDLYGIPNHNNVSWFVLKGKISIDNLQSTIYEKVINKIDSKGYFLYPTLRQFPVRFHKFLFWKWDREFKIEDYIYVYEKAKDDNKSWSEEDILDIQNKLLRKQWTRNQSPWEIFLIPSFKPRESFRESKTVMFFRFHESLGDPSSWFQLFILDLCDCDNVAGHHVPKSNKTEFKQFEGNQNLNIDHSHKGNEEINCKSVFKRIKQLAYDFMIPFKIPYDFATQALEPRDENDWNVEDTKLIKRDHFKIIDKFSIHHVRDVKNILGVSFTSVLLAACTSAVRTTLINLGMKIPRSMKISLPISYDCHCSDNLGNYLSPCYIKLPIGIASARERLRICEKSYLALRRSSFPASNIYLRYLLGLLPYKYFHPIMKNRLWTGNIVNLPGPLEYLSLADHPIEDIHFSSTSDSGFLISFLSYAESIRVSIVIDHRLIPVEKEELAKDFLKNAYAELVLLGIEGAV